MINQKEAVYNAVSEVKTFEDGEKIELTKDEKSTIKEILVTGFEAGEITLQRTQTDLPKYCTGLLNNWLRKDTRMNGGSTYVTKDKGSRTGNKDAQVRNLRILKGEATSPEDRDKIQAAIDMRLKEIKPEAVKKEVDFSVIPKELLESLGL